MAMASIRFRVPPTLEELCVHTAIDNLHRFGDVGDTDMELLRIILPHCTTDQLMHIENCTKERDLSPVTNELWKKCYGRDFGNEALDTVIEKLKARKVRFKWRALYEAKTRSMEEKQKKGVALLQQLCTEENNKKQSRRIQLCTKLPPEPKRKGFTYGGSSNSSSSISNSKGRLMKKARTEYAASNEARMMASIRNQEKQRARIPGVKKKF